MATSHSFDKQPSAQATSDEVTAQQSSNSGSTRRSFLKVGAAAVGSITVGSEQAAGRTVPVDSLSDIYSSAGMRLKAAQEGARVQAEQIIAASGRITAGKSTVALEAGGMETVATQMHRHAVEANRARQAILNEYMKETGLKVKPLKGAVDGSVQQANQALSSVKRVRREDAKALEDLKKQVQQIQKQEEATEAQYEEHCGALRELLVEAEGIRVVESTLGTTRRFIVTTFHHSADDGTDTHLGRKNRLRELRRDVSEQGIKSVSEPSKDSERWVIRNPRGALRAVLLEASLES